MSKITFRADDDLVERVEALDASKSEVMREALRAYLRQGSRTPDGDRLDEVVDERVERSLDERLGSPSDGQDLNVTIAVEPADPGTAVRASARDVSHGRASHADARTQNDTSRRSDGARPHDGRPDDGTDGRTCARCGETLSDGHVYCPNCGEKATRRLFCECGDELRSDWAYCPGCGRPTPSAELLDG